MKLLTVVVPMYQVEKYIAACLDSFVIPEIMEFLEVLVINDGTKDESRKISIEYQKKYPETFRIIDKENGGHGSAINRGIDEASGKYFKVVDGDDWVDRDGFLHLMQHLEMTNADMVLSNYNWVDHLTGKTSIEVENICPGLSLEKSVPFEEVANRIFMKMHALTYRTEIIKRQPERLDEHCFYVDTEYMLFPLPFIKTVSGIPDFVYQYRVGMAGQSMSIENMQKRCDQHEKVLKRILKFYEQYREHASGVTICNTVARVAVSQYKIYLSFPICHKLELVQMEGILKEKYPEIYQAMKNPAIRLLRKTKYAAFPFISLLVRKNIGVK